MCIPTSKNKYKSNTEFDISFGVANKSDLLQNKEILKNSFDAISK